MRIAGAGTDVRPHSEYYSLRQPAGATDNNNSSELQTYYHTHTHTTPMLGTLTAAQTTSSFNLQAQPRQSSLNGSPSRPLALAALSRSLPQATAARFSAVSILPTQSFSCTSARGIQPGGLLLLGLAALALREAVVREPQHLIDPPASRPPTVVHAGWEGVARCV